MKDVRRDSPRFYVIQGPRGYWNNGAWVSADHVMATFDDPEDAKTRAQRVVDESPSAEMLCVMEVTLGGMRGVANVRKDPRLPAPRFEEQVLIQLTCCGQLMQLRGNLSLRGAAGATCTRLGYKCEKCFRRVSVVDEWPPPTAADLNAIDATP